MNTWLLSQLYPVNPGFWIVLSLLALIPIKLTESHWSERQLRWLNMARWVLIPYVGLLAGSLSPQLMGLTGIDWAATLGIGIVVLVGLIAVLAAVRASLHDGRRASSEAKLSGMQQIAARHRRSWPDAAMGVLMAGAEQFHWSFLRGAVWEIMLLGPIAINLTGYWAVWIAALITIPEILLQSLTLADRIVKVAILVITAVLFIFTQNFWLCWLFHAAAWMTLVQEPQMAPLLTQKSTADRL